MSNLCVNIAKLLYKRGIRNICISPGLRNSAISLAFINHGKFNCHSIIDERSAAYFGVGLALKTHHPTVLICTSGTAVANYFPAIIEASQSRIPLIVITADRPVELLNSGENQTIHQKNIYGDFVRMAIDINMNDESNKMLSDINNSLQFIDCRNKGIVIGPIHINIHLNDFTAISTTKKFNVFNKSINRMTVNEFNWMMIPYEDVFSLYTRKRPLIIIGRLSQKLNKKLINQLSNHLNAPILADSLSQMRFDNKKSLSFYDHYIDNINMQPDLIIRIGQKPVSKKLCRQIELWEGNNNKMDFSSLLIDDANRFNDDCTTVIPCKYEDFINVMVNSTPKNISNDFYNYMINLDSKVHSILNDGNNDWSELNISKLCLASMSNNENLFIGNSMPIRYIDMIGKLNHNISINTYSNRGASGIDGVVASALGISKSSNKRSLLLIGDLSFIYDQSSLLIAKQYNIDLTIVIINNNGGGIFSQLPASNLINKKMLNTYWTTPHNIDLKKIAQLYDFQYTKVNNTQKLNTTLKKYKKQLGIQIIDAVIDINSNKKILKKFKNRIKKGTV